MTVFLNDGGGVYCLGFDSYTTLSAHGIIYKDNNGGYRLATEDELERDPGSAGVNHAKAGAVLGVIRAALGSQERSAAVSDEDEKIARLRTDIRALKHAVFAARAVVQAEGANATLAIIDKVCMELSE